MIRGLTRLGLIAALVTGCSMAMLTKTANDALTCATGILTEVAAGQADPALVALGHNPSVDQLVQALKDAQAMLPATILACSAFASDFSLPASPAPVPPATAAVNGPKVPNPWLVR